MTLLRRISELEKMVKKPNAEETEMTIPISAEDVERIFWLELESTDESKLEIENILAKYEGLPLITMDEREQNLIAEKSKQNSWVYAWR